MIDMIEKQQIILGYFRQGKSKKQLARELGISPHTVRRYIRKYREEIGIEATDSDHVLPSTGVVEPPRYDSSNRAKRKLTEQVRRCIDGYLEANELKRSQGKAKQQMLGTDIHQALIKQGYDISHRTVCRYIRQVKQRRREIYIRQHYRPGQSTQFDWAEVKLTIGEANKRMMLAVFTSSYSNHRWAQLFYRQDMSSFLQSHVNYFTSVGAVASEVVYDNMRVAVRKFTLKNADKEPTEDLLKLSTFYQFDYRFCNAGRGNEKGHVERSVEYLRRKAFAPRDTFDTLEQANAYLIDTCHQLNSVPVKGKTQSIADEFDQEIKHMKAAPGVYETAQWQSLRLDKYGCIRVDTNYYSVPEQSTGAFVNVKIYPDRIDLYADDNQLLDSHERRHTRHSYYLKLDHYLTTLLTKPGALAGSLSLHQADHDIKHLFRLYFKDQAKEFVLILLDLKKEKYSIDQLKNAVDQCITLCPHQPVCIDKVKFYIRQATCPSPIQSAPATDQMSQDIAQYSRLQLQDIQSILSPN